MSVVRVEDEKCSRCGRCADVCPVKIIALKKGGLPGMSAAAESFCLACGHCVAVCPEGALSHQVMAAADCPAVRPEWKLGPEQVEHFLRSRRSIRVYREEEVDRATLERLIRIARYAPSGHNSQPLSWLVVSGRVEMKKLAAGVVDWMKQSGEKNPELAARMNFRVIILAWRAGVDVVLREAPHLIAGHAPQSSLSAPAAARLALAHFELAAPSFGVGTCWAGFFEAAVAEHPPLREILALPPGHAVWGALMAGYPRYEYYRLPLRREPEITWRGNEHKGEDK